MGGFFYLRFIYLYISIFTREISPCYHPNDKGVSCGECGACNDRILAFKTLEIKDSIKYE